jgi:hypothetical protein
MVESLALGDRPDLEFVSNALRVHVPLAAVALAAYMEPPISLLVGIAQPRPALIWRTAIDF